MTMNECWVKDGSFYKPVVGSLSQLEAGTYCSGISQGEFYLLKLKHHTDDIVELPGLPLEEIHNQIEKFWARDEEYARYGFIHKRGILLHGPSGNGKTCVISFVVQKLIKKGGIVLLVDSFSNACRALQTIKSIEPDRRVMTLIEDMDTLLSGDDKVQEQYALSLLDGQAQCSGVVHMATTNYPEKLADRFIKRPGRFDMIVEMGMPKEITRRAYFQHILKNPNHPSLDHLVAKTEGLSLAYLREIASTYLCLDVPIEDSIRRIQKDFKSQLRPAVNFGKSANSGFEYEEINQCK